MATEAAPQILSTTVDRQGLSVVTSTKTADHPRLGSIYNPVTLAAATPVWFHPLQTGRHLALLRERWTGGTIGTGGPQSYSAHTAILLPSWATVDPVTGSVEAIGEIPSRLSGERLLLGAVSRIDSVYTIGTLDAIAHIAQYRVDTGGQLILQAEEVVPAVGGVDFCAGIYIDGNNMVLIGLDDDGGVYRARKSWGRVGQQRGAPWEYKGQRGWYVDPVELQPETTVAGIPFTSVETVSYAKVRDREWLVTHDGTNAHFWSSRMVDSVWRNNSVPDVACDWLYLQPQLDHNPDVLDSGVRAAVPWVATDSITTSGAQELRVAWGLLPV